MNVGILGVTGYTGVELLRLLRRHPEVNLTFVGSSSQAGDPLPSSYPHRQAMNDPLPSFADVAAAAEAADWLFLALPHGVSGEYAAPLLEAGCRVVDLSADLRLPATEYAAWYKSEPVDPALQEQAVYGLPELWKDEIAGARLVASPGCYPTASILALAPLVAEGWIETTGLIVDAKSGVTGAGRKASLTNHLGELYENFHPYGVAEHRHTPEIELALSRLAGGPVTVTLTPHLVPMARGLLVTAYARLRSEATTAGLLALYETFYAGRPFVRIFPEGRYPATKYCRGTNFCDIGLKVDARTGRVVVVAAIDNLVKGASGQAVQSMNLMAGFPETAGLELDPLYP